MSLLKQVIKIINYYIKYKEDKENKIKRLRLYIKVNVYKVLNPFNLFYIIYTLYIFNSSFLDSLNIIKFLFINLIPFIIFL
jgi:hypothetical protein